MIRGTIAVEAGLSSKLQQYLAGHVQTVHRCNSDYITAFHLDGWIMLDIYA